MIKQNCRTGYAALLTLLLFVGRFVMMLTGEIGRLLLILEGEGS